MTSKSKLRLILTVPMLAHTVRAQGRGGPMRGKAMPHQMAGHGMGEGRGLAERSVETARDRARERRRTELPHQDIHQSRQQLGLENPKKTFARKGQQKSNQNSYVITGTRQLPTQGRGRGGYPEVPSQRWQFENFPPEQTQRNSRPSYDRYNQLDQSDRKHPQFSKQTNKYGSMRPEQYNVQPPQLPRPRTRPTAPQLHMDQPQFNVRTPAQVQKEIKLLQQQQKHIKQLKQQRIKFQHQLNDRLDQFQDNGRLQKQRIKQLQQYIKQEQQVHHQQMKSLKSIALKQKKSQGNKLAAATTSSVVLSLVVIGLILVLFMIMFSNKKKDQNGSSDNSSMLGFDNWDNNNNNNNNILDKTPLPAMITGDLDSDQAMYNSSGNVIQLPSTATPNDAKMIYNGPSRTVMQQQGILQGTTQGTTQGISQGISQGTSQGSIHQSWWR